ncbi:MAG: TRAP transporter substrate-binding protein DctP [Syntrophomonadaceae bacterium]|nr:TRAP transporter substrate-binding protein DctP [Syntrophomonadaceae bacterium]
MRKTVLIAMVMLLLMLVVTAGCGGAKTAAPAPGGEQQAQKTYKLQLATTWPSAIMIHQMPVKWAEEIKAASGGRLQIEVHPAGAVVPAPEVLDATNAKTIDAYHTFSGYWIGKIPASPFFSSVPMTMEPFMHLVWVYEGGGLELWQRLYDEAGYNVKIIPLGIQHPETLAWSNKPLSKIADWQGLKYRTVGWWAEILRGSGVAVTSLPAAELYPALERGLLDALEFSSPYNDKVLAFYQVAKYLTGPGMHQPSVLFYVGINKDSWNALPADLQALMETSARSTTLWSWAKDFKESMAAIDYFKGKGIQVVKVDESVQKKLKEDTYAMLEKRAAERGGIFADIWNSVKDFRARFIQYEELMMPVRVK